VFNAKLGAPDQGPTGIAQINCPTCRHKTILDNPTYKRILPPEVAATVQEILTGPVRFGTATAAALSGVVVAGKTGTTSNYGDAWFVGWTPQMTTAVWVGYPNGLVSMANDFRGGPVEGGTYPAIIWHSFMYQALQILASEAPAKKSPNGTTTTDTTGSSLTPASPSSTSVTPTPGTTTPATGGGTTGGTGGTTGGGGGTTGGGGGTTGGGGGTTGGGGGTTGGGGGTTGGGGGTTGGGGGGTTGGGGGGTGGGSGGGGTGGAGLGGGGGPPPAG
jgi:penicillin-binding protein 1A